MGAIQKFDQLESFRDELATALEQCQENDRSEDGGRLVALCLEVQSYWRLRGPWALGDRSLGRAVEVARRTGDDKNLSYLLFAHAWILKQCGAWDEALQRYPHAA